MRRDWTDEQSRSLKFEDEADERSDGAFTGRVGTSVLLAGGLAPYLSYSTSFQPVLGSDFDGNPFKPTTGQQFEAGIKYAHQLRPLFLTVAAFRITKQNVSTADRDHEFWTIQTGEIRSRGLEAEARLDIARRLMLIGAYTLTDVANTRSTTHIDKTPVGISKHMGSIWAQVDPGLAGLRLNGGIRYVGPSWGDADNALEVPAYTLLDAGLRLLPGEIGFGPDGWEIGATATNLLDRTYVSQCVGVNDCSYGLARSVQLYLKYAW